MIYLHQGVMTPAQLAQWFGVKIKTYYNNPDKYLARLQDYAVFRNLGHGKVQIQEVISNIYAQPNNYIKVKNRIDENWDKCGIDTKKDVADKIKIKFLSDNTVYQYVCKGSNELYGNPREKQIGGEIGNCWYVTCILDAKTHKRRPLNDKEKKQRARIRDKYFGADSYYIQMKESFMMMRKKGQISKELYNAAIESLDSNVYWAYIAEVEEMLKPNVYTYGIYKMLYDE